MGGHGALYLAIRHQDVFGAAGSMSGGVDFRPFPEKWDIKLRLGDQKTHKENWDKNTVMAQLPLLKDGALQLIIDCGTEDFFFDVNVKLHEALTNRAYIMSSRRVRASIRGSTGVVRCATTCISSMIISETDKAVNRHIIIIKVRPAKSLRRADITLTIIKLYLTTTRCLDDCCALSIVRM